MARTKELAGTTHEDPIRWPRRVVEIVICGGILLPLLFYPLARDQGLFAYIGQVILDGGVPYADVYDQKGPATHYFFAAILAVFGESTLSVRFAFYIVALGVTQMAATMGQRLLGPRARIPCAISYALVAVQAHRNGPWMSGQVEDILVALNFATLLLLTGPDGLRNLPKYCSAAFLMGLACVFKPTAVLETVVIVAISTVWMLRWSNLTTRESATRLIVGACAFFLPTVIFGVYLWLAAALDDFWMFVVDHNINVYSKLQSGHPGDFIRIGVCFGPVAVVALGSFLRVPKGKSLLFALLWGLALAGLSSVVLQSKYFILYHWTPCVAALAVAAGLGWTNTCDLFCRRCASVPLRGAIRAALLVVFFCALPASIEHLGILWWRCVQTVSGQMSLKEFRGPFRVGGSKSRATDDVAAYIQQRTSKDDSLLVWGYDVALNFHSQRRAPSRFVMNRVLARESSPHIRAWRDEFLHDVRSKAPPYVVVVDEQSWRDFIPNPRDHLAAFREFHDHLATNYKLDRRIDHFDIYRRSDFIPPRF